MGGGWFEKKEGAHRPGAAAVACWIKQFSANRRARFASAENYAFSRGFCARKSYFGQVRADIAPLAGCSTFDAQQQEFTIMGRRGRPPMPPYLRVLKGNPGGPGRARPQIEPTITDAIPESPAWLTGYALDQWHAVAPELHRLGLLTVLDIGSLSAYCTAAGRWRSASEALQATPEAERLVVGRKPQPLVKIVRDAADQMQRLGTPFGLGGPVSRSRLAGVVKQAPGKFAGLLGGGGEPAV
jgi:P27 family predicted phage terminase small subunit